MKLFGFLVTYFAVVMCDFTPITSEEAEILRATWAQVQNREIDILYAIFKENPDIQARFPAFVGKDIDHMRGSTPFAIHSTRIVGFFNQLIKLTGNPNNMPATKTLVSELRESHKNRGIPKDLFTKFRSTFMKFLENNLTGDAETTAIWNKAFDNFYTLLFADYD